MAMDWRPEEAPAAKSLGRRVEKREPIASRARSSSSAERSASGAERRLGEAEEEPDGGAEGGISDIGSFRMVLCFVFWSGERAEKKRCKRKC